ncbi:MAG: hypothetical protein PF487_13185 [Bacteroidales bacterium]|jgi:hypothetical protein|nr:hypothetical protein [Bacteroidales bacterium]
MSIGKKLSPVLDEIEQSLWEYEVEFGNKPDYTLNGFRAGIKIFMSVMMDKVWELQQNEKITMDDRIKMVEQLGKDVRKLIKIYTDIDTHELY